MTAMPAAAVTLAAALMSVGFSVLVVRGAMTVTAVLVTSAAAMLVTLSVVTALYIRIILQAVAEKSLYSLVGISAGSAVKLDSRFGKSRLSSSAYASAYEYVNVVICQKYSKRAMPAVAGINYLGVRYFSV